MRLIIFLTFAISFVGCSTSSDVVSSHLIQKRKYRAGFHLNMPLSTHKSTTTEASVESNTTLQANATTEAPSASEMKSLAKMSSLSMLNGRGAREELNYTPDENLVKTKRINAFRLRPSPHHDLNRSNVTEVEIEDENPDEHTTRYKALGILYGVLAIVLSPVPIGVAIYIFSDLVWLILMGSFLGWALIGLVAVALVYLLTSKAIKNGELYEQESGKTGLLKFGRGLRYFTNTIAYIYLLSFLIWAVIGVIVILAIVSSL